MTREEFEAALDRYIVPDKRWGHADKESMCWGKNEGQECCLEQKPVRDFLFDLMTNGIGAVDKLPPKKEPQDSTACYADSTGREMLAPDRIADYDRGDDE